MRAQQALHLILCTCLVIIGFAGGIMWSAGDREVVQVPATYPCQEDEWYGHWPGYDGPVCVHRELVEAQARGEDYSPGSGVRVP